METFDDVLYRINLTDYTDADLNQLRNDLTTLIEKMHRELLEEMGRSIRASKEKF